MKQVDKTQQGFAFWTWAARIFFTLAVIAVTAFIFSNSLATGESSSLQSYAVTEQVQEVARVVAPNSKIATAQGEDFIRLHISVRTAAHFCQFALLGAVAFACYLSYTRLRVIALVPTLGTAAVAVIDECLQLFSEGRAFEWADVLVDVFGGLAGCVFSAAVFVVLKWLIFKISRSKEQVTDER